MYIVNILLFGWLDTGSHLWLLFKITSSASGGKTGPYLPRDSDSLGLGRASNECIFTNRQLDALIKTWKERENTKPHILDPRSGPDCNCCVCDLI